MSKTIANVSATVSTTTGVWAWIGNNSGALSVSIAFISLCIATVFYALNYRQTLKKAHDEHEIRVLEKIKLAKSLGMDLNEVISGVNGLKKVDEMDRRKRH